MKKIKKNLQSEEVKNINNLFAEFLGYTLVTPEMRKNPENWKISYWEKPITRTVLGPDGGLKFFEKISHLNKVYSKILSLNHKIICENTSCFIEYPGNIEPTDSGHLFTSIYLECFGFVKWFNSNK